MYVTVVVGGAGAGVVAPRVLDAARAVAARRGRARVARVHLAVVAAVTRRAQALISTRATRPLLQCTTLFCFLHYEYI